MKLLLRADGEALLRFKREFRSLQDVDHPNLVRLHELVEQEGDWFFTMELVEGVDLLQYVRHGVVVEEDVVASFSHAPTIPASSISLENQAAHRFDEGRLRDGLSQLALGIATLHGADKIHRDVKPSNALVTNDHRVVLLDLGLVSAPDDSQNLSEQHLVGTPSYMAPEQARGHAVAASDWYSVGVILYEALTGALPFSGSPLDVLMQKQEREAVAPNRLMPGVQDDWNGLCVDLLRRDPDKRPSGREVLRRLGMSGSIELDSAAARSASIPFVGRRAELAQLRSAYEDVLAGGSVTVVVHGESGLGKSALMREFIAGTLALSSETPLVFSGRCYANESVSYNAIDGVMDSLSAHMRRLDRADASALVSEDDALLLLRAFPVLAQVETFAHAPLWRGDVRDPDELQTRLLLALRELYRRLSARGPCIIAIDDLQWANRDSLLLLAELMRGPDSPPLLLVVTSRPDPEGAARPEFGLPGDLRYVDLTALTDGAATSLARTLLAGAGLSVAMSQDIAVEADGHPLHIDALIRHVAHSGNTSHTPHLDEAILARAETLSDSAQRALHVICLAGAPTPQDVVALAIGLDSDEFSYCFGALRVHNLARSPSGRNDAIEPYHDRVREAVAARISSNDRRQYHAKLAAALESSGVDEELLVRHQEASGQSERAAATAQRAARTAYDALAFDRCAELYQTALRLGQHRPEDERAIQERLSEALASAGRGAEAAESYLLAAKGADRATRLECFRRAAEQWLMTGHIDRGLTTLRELFAENNASYPASPRRAMLSLLASRLTLRVRGLGWKSKDESQLGREHLTRVDLYSSVGQGMGMVDTIRGAAFQSRGLLLALRAGEPSRVGHALSLESVFLASQGGRSIKRARKLIERTRVLAGEDDYLTAWALSATGISQYFEGRFADAAATLEQALVRWRQHPAGNTFEKNNTAVFLLLAYRLRGDATKLAALATEMATYARRRGDRYLETTVLRASSIAWLCCDRVDVAQAHLDSASWVPPEGRFHLQHWYQLEARCELALYEGRGATMIDSARAELAHLRRSLLTRIQTVRIAALWLQGRLYLAGAQQDDAYVSKAARCARALAKEKVGYATDCAHLLRGGIKQIQGDLDGAQVHFAEVTSSQMVLAGTLARRWLSLRAGSPEQLAEATKELDTLGIVHPEQASGLFCLRSSAPE